MYTYKYPRLALTVDAIVYTNEENQKHVLLIERGKEPFYGKWALPGGFVEMDELLENACIRELQEETGLEVKEMKQFRTYDEINRDPRHRTISVVYSVEVAKQLEAKGGDDAAKAAWHSLSDLPELAFDHHRILSDFFGNL